MSKSTENELAIEILDAYLADELDQDLSAAEVAKHLKQVKKHEGDECFLEYVTKLPNDTLGDVVLELPDHFLKEIIDVVPSVQMVEAIEDLESDDATDLLQEIHEIDEEKAKEIFDSLDSEYQEDIKRLRRYDEDSAGAYMQTEIFVAKIDEKVQDAITRFRELKAQGELENIHQLFIVDDYETLLFAISLEDLITFDFEQTFKEVIATAEEDEYRPILARDDDDIEHVIETFEDHDLMVLPIIDYHGKLVGRITGDDIHDIIRETATEQIYNLAGVNDDAEQEHTLLEAGRTRALWLGLNLLTAIIASLVIGIFDQTIQAYVALAVLMPIVASMGGNAGTQTLTVTVRQMALGEIDFANAKDALYKEVVIALANGCLFALVMGIIAYFWFHEILLGVVIAASMVINLFCAGLFGALIPLGLKRSGIDPAVGSTVLLTTVTDVVGFFSFLGLAQWILING